MTLEQMLATPSVVAALVVVAVVVFVVAFLLGRRQGFQDVQDGVDPNDPSLFGAAKNTSLFGPRVPVQSTERQLVAAAALYAPATAWELSMAGMMPSVSHRSLNALMAS